MWDPPKSVRHPNPLPASRGAAQSAPLVFANDRECRAHKEETAGGVRRMSWDVPAGAIGASGICTLRVASADGNPVTVQSVELSIGPPAPEGGVSEPR